MIRIQLPPVEVERLESEFRATSDRKFRDRLQIVLLAHKGRQHKDVAAAAAVGVPDELYGEEVAAVIVLKDGGTISEQEVIEFCKARLADYKCPKTVHFVEDIPKGPTGKLLKRELAQMLKGKS